MMDDFSWDQAFGPQFRAAFDFTLEFEHLMLSIVPSTVLIASVPVFYFLYAWKTTVCRGGLLLWIKLSTVTALAVTEALSLAFWLTRHGRDTETATAANSTSLVAAVSLGVILYWEQRYALRASSFVALWLILTLLCDVVKSRSTFMRHDLGALGALATSSASLKLAILVLEELPKDSLVTNEELKLQLGPESTCGFFSRTLFTWLYELFILGFRNILRVEQLKNLGPEFSSQHLCEQVEKFWCVGNAPEHPFYHHYDKNKYELENSMSSHALADACYQVLQSSFLSIGFPRFLLSAFTLAQAGLVYLVLTTIEDQNKPRNNKDGLMIGATLVYLGLMASKSHYKHLTYRFGVRIRGALDSLIYKKSLHLNYAEAQKLAGSTLMSTDVDNLVLFIVYYHEFWASIMEVCVCLVLLALIVKATAALVVIPSVVCVTSGYFIGKYLPESLKAWNAKIENRVAKTSQVLKQIRPLKMIGLDGVTSKYLQGFRNSEMNYSKASRKWTVVLLTVGSICESSTAPLIFAGALFWTGLVHHFEPRDVYTILTVVQLIIEPLQHIIESYSFIQSAFACLQRVQDYLKLEQGNEFTFEDVPSDRIDELSREASRSKTSYLFSRLGRGAIDLFNVSITRHGQNQPLFTGVSVHIDPSDIVTVVGATGSGKTAILEFLLSQVASARRSIYLKPGTAGYCPHRPWIENKSIRDNIIGQGRVDENWYESVIHACSLRQDLEAFPEGDRTMAGSNGAVLSGGQKHRVALARALYARPRYLIVDDIFAAIDRKSFVDVAWRVFGPLGLAKSYGITTILVTYLLPAIEYADRILLVDNGTITTHNDLSDPDFHQRVLEIVSQVSAIGVADDTVSQPAPKTLSEDDTTSETDNVPAPCDRKLYVFYMQAFHLTQFVVWTCMNFMMALTECFPDAYMNIWLEKDAQNKLYFIGYATVSVSCAIFTFFTFSLWFFKLVPGSALHLHQSLVDVLMRAKLSYLTATDHGTIINLVSQDMTLISQSLPLSFLRTVYYFFYVVVRVAMVVASTVYSAVIVPLFVAVLYLVQVLYLRTSRQIRHFDLESKSPLYTHFDETATGLRHIQGHGWKEKYIDEMYRRLDDSQKPYYYMFAIQRWLEVMTDSVTTCTVLLILGISLYTNFAVSTSNVGLGLVSLIGISKNSCQLIIYWTSLETSIGALSRLKDFIHTTPVEEEPEDEEDLPEAWPHKGEIEIENVVARYGADGDSPPILKDITISIPASQKVGIIGRTGCGKSSLLMLLLKFLEYTGKITIDGIDIARLSPYKLRRHIITISQDSIEFDASVRFNLCPLQDEKDVDNDAAIKMLTRLGIWGLMKERGGLDAKVSDLKMSEGQLQLLCIARACLHKTTMGGRLVIMDEPTGILDMATEANAQDVMEETFADCTVLNVAHRVETLPKWDIVICMDRGQIIDKRDGSELLVSDEDEGGNHGNDENNGGNPEKDAGGENDGVEGSQPSLDEDGGGVGDAEGGAEGGAEGSAEGSGVNGNEQEKANDDAEDEVRDGNDDGRAS